MIPLSIINKGGDKELLMDDPDALQLDYEEVVNLWDNFELQVQQET
jgi:hypothetical protein